MRDARRQKFFILSIYVTTDNFGTFYLYRNFCHGQSFIARNASDLNDIVTRRVAEVVERPEAVAGGHWIKHHLRESFIYLGAQVP